MNWRRNHTARQYMEYCIYSRQKEKEIRRKNAFIAPLKSLYILGHASHFLFYKVDFYHSVCCIGGLHSGLVFIGCEPLSYSQPESSSAVLSGGQILHHCTVAHMLSHKRRGVKAPATKLISGGLT